MQYPHSFKYAVSDFGCANQDGTSSHRYPDTHPSNGRSPHRHASGCSDVFVRDRQSGMVERVSVASDGTPGNHESGIRYEQGSLTSISGDGRFIAFWSLANNLMPGDTNERGDIFIRDLQSIWLTLRPDQGSPGSILPV